MTDWRNRTDLPPVQREACEWMAEHGIDPRCVPLHGVTVKRRKVIAKQRCVDAGGHPLLDPDTGEWIMDTPVKRRIKRQPPDRVRAFLRNPDQALSQHRIAELADTILAMLTHGGSKADDLRHRIDRCLPHEPLPGRGVR